MAADKRKILENARKLAQKNAKEKALAEYQKLLKLDPKDAKLRLEVGDAHRRWGQVDEAVDTYQRVAEQYMDEGFDARAVAVFKQILNLVPDRLEAYAPLAELYERMGLTAEALAALQTAADGYHRQGNKGEALALLRKMANADPANTRSRIKVADLLRQEGKNDDAVAEYLLAAEELERQGDVDAVGGVYRRILEVDERNVRALSTLAKTLGLRGKPNEAIPLAERALQLDDGNAERYEHLATLFEQAKKAPEHERVMRRLAELYRSRGDESRARDILQRFASVNELSDAASDVSEVSPVPDDELSGGGLLDEDANALFGDEFPDTEGAPELAIDFGSELEIGPGASLSGAKRGPSLAESTRIADEAEELLLEDVHEPKATPGDWDQLLAEASVYLRYGKRDKAIAQLQRVIEANPNHRSALEKLGEAHAESGDHAQAVQVWLRAALRAHDEGDTEAMRVLRARIAVLDESAAAHIPGDSREVTAAKKAPAPAKSAPARPASEPAKPVAPAKPAAPAPTDLVLDGDDEFLDDLALDDASAQPAPQASREIDLALDDDEELSLDESGELSLGDEPSTEMDSSSGIELDLEGADDESGVDVDFGGDVELTDEPAPATVAAASLGGAERQDVLDQLEEADFYMQQGLHDEAESLYRGVLAAAPGHPRATQRLAEIADARGGAAPPRVAVDQDETPVPEIDFDEEGELTQPETVASESDEVEISVDFSDDEIGESAPVGVGAELDDLASLDLDDADAAPIRADDEAAADGSDTEELLRPAVEAPRSAAPELASPIAAAAPADEGDFDLAAALSDAFDDDSQSGVRSPLPAGDDGFAAVFSAFKKGVRETLGEGDHQAHYDLAIAYKEMGLYEDAIYELRTAMADPSRTAECLHLIGLCAIDSNQTPLAIEHLEQLLSLPRLSGDAALAARFDLGRAFEAIGDIEGARSAWQAVAAQKPDFQGVRGRLAGLGEPKPDPGADGLESFTDMLEGADPEPAEVAVGGETFDDLVAEANTDPAAAAAHSAPLLDAEPVDEAELVVESEPVAAEPATAPPPRAPKPPPPRRKKKISFL